MANYEKRLSALSVTRTYVDYPTGEELDAAIEELTKRLGIPPTRGMCDECDEHAKLVIAWLRADLDGYPIPEPASPTCWRTH
jgi:hypothetical protein